MARFSPAFVCVILFFTQDAAAREVTSEEAVELMEECQRQREVHIAPLREQEIERCISGGRDRGHCERFNRDFGESYRLANGYWQQGLFWDLPVCEDAYAAERYFKMNPRARSFTLP